MLCTVTGKVVLVDGPYSGDDNNKDDKIWDSIVSAPDPVSVESDTDSDMDVNSDDESVHDIHKIFERGSNEHWFVLDRGYLGCKTKNIYRMLFPPKWLESKDSQKQLTLKQANEGRYVPSVF